MFVVCLVKERIHTQTILWVGSIEFIVRPSDNMARLQQRRKCNSRDADNDESQRGDDDANGGEIGDSEKHEVDVGNPQYDGRNPSHPLDVHLRAIFFAGGVVAGYPPVGFACSNQYSQNE